VGLNSAAALGEIEESQDSGPAPLEAPVVRTPAYRYGKRALDVTLAVPALALALPLMAVAALLIKVTSPGPVFYAWDVLGRGGRPFRGYKLRTMVPWADALKPQLKSQNEMNGPVFKMRRDPRIIAVGRFLRRYSIDELPQLWSVVRGDMSLVGPRPAFQSEWDRYEPWQKRRLAVTPGITCLWQVQGRHAISHFDEWARLDVEYVDRWSLALDLRILFKTIFVVLRGTGA